MTFSQKTIMVLILLCIGAYVWPAQQKHTSTTAELEDAPKPESIDTKVASAPLHGEEDERLFRRLERTLIAQAQADGLRVRVRKEKDGIALVMDSPETAIHDTISVQNNISTEDYETRLDALNSSLGNEPLELMDEEKELLSQLKPSE